MILQRSASHITLCGSSLCLTIPHSLSLPQSFVGQLWQTLFVGCSWPWQKEFSLPPPPQITMEYRVGGTAYPGLVCVCVCVGGACFAAEAQEQECPQNILCLPPSKVGSELSNLVSNQHPWVLTGQHRQRRMTLRRHSKPVAMEEYGSALEMINEVKSRYGVLTSPSSRRAFGFDCVMLCSTCRHTGRAETWSEWWWCHHVHPCSPSRPHPSTASSMPLGSEPSTWIQPIALYWEAPALSHCSLCPLVLSSVPSPFYYSILYRTLPSPSHSRKTCPKFSSKVLMAQSPREVQVHKLDSIQWSSMCHVH